MIYQLNKKNYRHFRTIEDNKLPGRAYFIPFSSELKAASTSIINRRYASDKVRCLNGVWDFAYYADPRRLPKKLDTSSVVFDRIEVPSCWQNLGYEPPFYTNADYPFRPAPPKVPENEAAGEYKEDINGIRYACGKKQYNSAGVYRTFIEIKDLKKRYILSFLGVCSCLDLYLNGRYVGYSEGSHNTAEFNIDPYITEGSNELVAVVRKWCNGSYLEDQDMLRLNGIFRDVLLYVNEPSYIYDFRFRTMKHDSFYDAELLVRINGFEECKIQAALTKGNKKLASAQMDASPETRFVFTGLQPEEWSAEIPNLYDLTLTLYKNKTVSEVIVKQVGFRSIVIDSARFLFNGKPIKLKGVNHHDNNPCTGYYLSPAEIEKDIRIFKAYNINAVRTSHYPPDPMFIELCDLHGIYVVDEADIECHGAQSISSKKSWRSHFWDRVYRMYLRDGNSASITMWSLGNECHGILCQDFCYKNLKALSPIPIHYEGACRTRRIGYDVYSEMYTSVENCRKIAAHAYGSPARKSFLNKKPFFMCEYAHAMGLGPGGLEEYWQTIYNAENMMGGCVWEFADHSVYHPGKKYQYTYGGDHGEYRHDGNFCLDGLFGGERMPHTGAFAVKNIYRPVRASFAGKGLVKFTNYNSFRSSGYLAVNATLYKDGKKTGTYDLSCDIPPGESQIFNLLIDDVSGDIVLDIDYWDASALVATEQLRIAEHLTSVKTAEALRIAANESENLVTVVFEGGKMVFDKNTGAILQYSCGQTDYFAKKPLRIGENKGALYTNLFRAPTDNDKIFINRWYHAGYDSLSPVLRTFAHYVKEGVAYVKVSLDLVNSKKQSLFLTEDNYAVQANGSVRIRTRLVPLKKNLPILPRIGKILELDRRFDDVIYYGMGDKENYPDFRGQSRLGVFRSKAEDFMTDYIKPQESGNRCDVRYAVIRDNNGEGLMLLADTAPFNFGAKRCSDAELASRTHREDVCFSEDRIYYSVDGYMCGIGSGSCGPGPLEEYKLDSSVSYAMSFTIIPFQRVMEDNFTIQEAGCR
jgi:beta-galactosidase